MNDRPLSTMSCFLLLLIIAAILAALAGFGIGRHYGKQSVVIQYGGQR